MISKEELTQILIYQGIDINEKIDRDIRSRLSFIILLLCIAIVLFTYMIVSNRGINVDEFKDVTYLRVKEKTYNEKCTYFRYENNDIIRFYTVCNKD